MKSRRQSQGKSSSLDEKSNSRKKELDSNKRPSRSRGTEIVTGKCKICGSNSWDTDSVRGETICAECGYVAAENMIDPGAEWTNHSGGEDRSRVGAPTSLTISDKGLSTEISRIDLTSGAAARHGMTGKNLRDWRRRQRVDQRSKTRDSNDWYGGGWTRVPADGNIPVGTRRFVGAGKINISAVEDDKQPEVSNEVVEENIGSNMIEDDMISRANKWTLELSEMLENSDSNENIDAIKADFDSRFEEEISQLPLVAQAPARAIWKMKSDALVTVAKTKLSNDNAKVVAGLGIAGAAIGAVSAINQPDKMNNADVELVPDIEQSPIEKEEISESIESSHNTPQVEVPDRVEIPEQISSEEWADEHEVEVPEKVDLPDRVSVTEPLSESFSDTSKEGSSVDVGISLDEIINQMNGARFLNEQRELISNYKGKNFDLSFRVNSVDRTFGIGISEEYRRGSTLNVTSESNEIEVRMRNDYDISDISSGREMSLKVSVVDWNSIRKRLVVNSV